MKFICGDFCKIYATVGEGVYVCVWGGGGGGHSGLAPFTGHNEFAYCIHYLHCG